MSGGGTVYHDLGNSNYSMIMPRGQFDRQKWAQTITEIINKDFFGGKGPADRLQVNERHDIYLLGSKVSGSAYRLGRHRAYHHGTFLRRTRLDVLERVLTPSMTSGSTLGVGSVRAPRVANVDMEHDEMCSAVTTGMEGYFDGGVVVDQVNPIDVLGSNGKLGLVSAIRSWDWMFRHSPSFTDQQTGIRVTKGVISSPEALAGVQFDKYFNVSSLYADYQGCCHPGHHRHPPLSPSTPSPLKPPQGHLSSVAT